VPVSQHCVLWGPSAVPGTQVGPQTFIFYIEVYPTYTNGLILCIYPDEFSRISTPIQPPPTSRYRAFLEGFFMPLPSQPLRGSRILTSFTSVTFVYS
jgi:hypothetical protein